MTSIFSILRYLRLKFLVSFIRFASKLLAPFPKPKPDSILRIPSRDKRYTIKIHLYKPSTEGVGENGPHPVLISFYGSGFALTHHGMDDSFCRHIATATDYVVLDVQYRVGPENPFPASINDVQDAVKYVFDHPDEYKTSQVSVSGFSSGGTLALVTPLLFPRGTFRSVTAFYPATDLASDPALRRPPAANAKPRSTYWTKVFRQGYIGEMDARDPRISPAYADTANYPSDVLVVTGELDSSALEAEELAEKIKNDTQAGRRNVVIRRMKGCGHGFDKKNKYKVDIEARDETYGLVVDMLKKVAN